MTDQVENFRKLFLELTAREPFPWQAHLAERFLSNDIPSACDIPTGIGKTSIIPIWLICLGLKAERGTVHLPRRLIYTVNRRVIVDQATDEVNQILSVLGNPPTPGLDALQKALRALSTDQTRGPVAVSTLRGGLADNQEWKVDPARAAIIIGTVDMIGSKLFFSGFGDGKRDRPLHAGLLGQDALIVHDESHLMPAFGKSLQTAVSLNRKGVSLRPFHAIDLSATQTGDSRSDLLSLTDADFSNPVIRRRMGLEESGGRKRLELHRGVPRREAAAFISDLAARHHPHGVAVLVYVRTVDLARRVREKLLKRVGKDAEDSIVILTGTLRGYERDRLMDLDAFKRFLPGRERTVQDPATVYLISTSAGEVGVNLDADHCVCDLTTLENMVQRFGRVNRFGLFPESEIDVVWVEEEFKKQTRGKKNPPNPLARTWEVLGAMNGDASVHNLSELLRSPELVRDAFSPMPLVLDLDAWTLDTWSTTGINARDYPQRPDVSVWLHGLTEEELPETHLLWRFDLPLFVDDEASEVERQVKEYLELFPVHRQELLKERTSAVRRALAEIHERCIAQGRKQKGILIDSDGDVVLDTLENLSRARLEWGTVILPTDIGGLSSSGLLDTSEETLRKKVADVGDQSGVRERFLFQRDTGSWECHQSDGRAECLASSSLEEAARRLAQTRGYRLSTVLEYIKITDQGEETTNKALVVLANPERSLPPSENLPAYSRQPQTLAAHLSRSEEAARLLASKFSLPDAMAQAICIAARWHDKGKDRVGWQKAIGNFKEEPLAKSGRTTFNHRFTRGYRHEFGSLLDAERDPQVRDHPESDLILHLIAAHHGNARPGFSEQAYDRTFPYLQNYESTQAGLNRFTSLQCRFGWWQLAWLETLVKAADAMGAPQ